MRVCVCVCLCAPMISMLVAVRSRLQLTLIFLLLPLLLDQTWLVYDLVLDNVPQQAPWHSKDGSAGCWSG